MGQIGEIVRSNNFSRCSSVMASAMTVTMSGLRSCWGTGELACLECVTWLTPCNPETTEVVTMKLFSILPILHPSPFTRPIPYLRYAIVTPEPPSFWGASS